MIMDRLGGFTKMSIELHPSNPFPDLGADNLYDALMTSRPLKGWSREDAETITQYRLKFGQWMMKPEGSIMEIGAVLICVS